MDSALFSDRGGRNILDLDALGFGGVLDTIEAEPAQDVFLRQSAGRNFTYYTHAAQNCLRQVNEVIAGSGFVLPRDVVSRVYLSDVVISLDAVDRPNGLISFKSTEGRAVVNAIVVTTPFRGTGVSTDLIRRVTDLHNYTAVQVNDSNKPYLTLLGREGFVETPVHSRLKAGSTVYLYTRGW